MNSVFNLLSRTLSCQKLLKPNNLTVRRISILEKIRRKPKLLDKTDHKIIYEFKYVVFTAGFLRTKYLFPIVSAPIISASLYFNDHQIVSLLIIANVLQFILVFGFSKLTKNMIGKIYVNKEGKIENVILSYINSNGSRTDKSFCTDELHWTETGNMRFLGFVNVKTSEENYKLNIASACIHDTKALQGIFKDILSIMKVKRKPF